MKFCYYPEKEIEKIRTSKISQLESRIAIDQDLKRNKKATIIFGKIPK